MAGQQLQHDIFLEIGKRRVFAGAVDWPGWCRSGRDEASAIQALLACAPRYAQILQSTDLGFQAPEDASAFQIVERLDGNATTDFGAPDAQLSTDAGSLHGADMKRLEKVLRSSWLAFDRAVDLAAGKELRKGPRGGGRELMAIVEHVLAADVAYLRRIGWKVEPSQDDDVGRRLDHMRAQILAGFRAAARGELPTQGPRGGKRWSPHVFARRVAWHAVDHAWEIEDRIQ